jgi:hypothetical protein
MNHSELNPTWVEVAAQIEAIGAARKSLDGYIDEIWNTTILEAVYPLIESEVRERVALGIEAAHDADGGALIEGQSDEYSYCRAYTCTHEEDAAIARGKENSG